MVKWALIGRVLSLLDPGEEPNFTRSCPFLEWLTNIGCSGIICKVLGFNLKFYRVKSSE
jgi:hypothetical protein